MTNGLVLVETNEEGRLHGLVCELDVSSFLADLVLLLVKEGGEGFFILQQLF